MKIPEKSRDMICLLRERILSGSYFGGQRLPSIRMLMDEFSMSNGSVKKGIDYLAKQGLLETIHGSGTFVGRRNDNSQHSCNKLTKSIAVFSALKLSGNAQGIFASVLTGMMQMADKRACQLQLNPLPVAGLTADYIATQSSGTDGIVFLCEVDAILTGLSLSLPAVGVCVHLPAGNSMSFVNLDPWSSALQAVDYFKHHNINQVEIISPLAPVYRHRASVFAEIWRNAGGLVSEYYCDKCEEMEFTAGSGYLFTTCSAMQRCLNSYNQQHGSLPNNIIIGLDGKNFVEPSYYSMPAIMLDWEQAGEVVVDECLRRIDNSGSIPRRIYLSGYFKM